MLEVEEGSNVVFVGDMAVGEKTAMDGWTVTEVAMLAVEADIPIKIIVN